ncbi:MAG: SurA N-terminal domain-containing protein [Candidatus Jettenia sp.]|nr:SurA N-terminal domain-containing protein [Candidatus Jettenia sp.]
MVSSSWFRRHQKIVYIIMIFSMVVWGVSYSAMEMIPKKPVGKVLGRKITQNEFADMLRRWQRLFFSQANESIVSLVWKQLIFVEEAQRMGIMVTTQEIEEGIQRLAFQMFGTGMNMNKYSLIQFLCSNFKLNQDDIERTLREALLVEKLESAMRASTKMTTEETWQRYSMENEQVKFKALTLRANGFLNSVNVTEDEIRSHYEKYKNDEYNEESHQPGYKLPERVKMECLIAKFDDMEKQVSVPEDEMKKYYEDNKEVQFKITEVDTKPEDAKADKTVIEENKNNQKKEKKKNSNEGKEHKEETVTTYKSFDEVKGDIQKTLVRQKAIEKTTEIMTKLDEEIYESIDKEERTSFKDLANTYKVTYQIPKGKKTENEFLTENDLLEIFPGSDQIIQAAFDREKYEPSIPFDFVEGKVIFQVIDKKLPAPAPLEEIKNQVVNDLKLEKALHRAKEVAEKHAGTAAKTVSFDDMVKSIKAECGQIDIPVSEIDYITRPIKLFNKDSKYIEALKEDRPNVAKKAFELKLGQRGVAVEPLGEKACYILEVIDKKPADKSAFEKDKENIAKRYLFEKQEAFISEWQTNINRHIEIYTKFQ